MSHGFYLLFYVREIYKCSFSVHLLNSFLFAIRNTAFKFSCGSVALSSAEVATSGEDAFDVGLRCMCRDSRPGLLQMVTGSGRTPRADSGTVARNSCTDSNILIFEYLFQWQLIVVNCMTFFSYSVTVFSVIIMSYWQLISYSYS